MKQLPGGEDLLAYSKGILSEVLQRVYPRYQWSPWQFDSLPENFWKNTDNQMNYFSQLLKLDTSTAPSTAAPNPWENLLDRFGGRVLFYYYNGSLQQALQTLPTTRTTTTPTTSTSTSSESFWSVPSNQKNYLNWLERTLGLKYGESELTGWYTIQRDDILQMGGLGFLNYCRGDLHRMLESYVIELSIYQLFFLLSIRLFP